MKKITFNIHIKPGSEGSAVRTGYQFEARGIQFATDNRAGHWYVTDLYTGFSMGARFRFPTRKRAIEATTKFLKGEAFYTICKYQHENPNLNPALTGAQAAA